MGSSGDSGGNPMALSQGATPQPGLPIAGAGKDSMASDPFEYGKFQNFLPDPAPSGPNPMATGIRPDMLQYKSPGGGHGGGPGGGMPPGGGAPGGMPPGVGGQGDILAALKARLGGG